jgi:hypothetical protein
MNRGRFVRIGLPFWSIEFMMTLFYSRLDSDNITAFGMLVVVISIIVLPLVIGAKIATFGGSIKLAMLGAILVTAASLLAVAVSCDRPGESKSTLLGYPAVIATVFVVPPAAFGFVGALLVKYSKALSS